MNSKFWSRKALSACLIVALYVTYSMVALANADNKMTGELIVNGKSQVTVNGEVAQSGRSIFSDSTITTADNGTATINLGKVGKIELAPNSSLIVNFDQNSITGNLSSGSVTVIGSADTTSAITTANGKVSSETAGNTFTVNAENAVQNSDYEDCSQDTNNDGKKDCVCIDADKDGKLECNKGGGGAWWIWGGVFAAAATGILWAAFSDNNTANIGGGGTVVSPSR
jgi:hypothetical protein